MSRQLKHEEKVKVIFDNPGGLYTNILISDKPVDATVYKEGICHFLFQNAADGGLPEIITLEEHQNYGYKYSWKLDLDHVDKNGFIHEKKPTGGIRKIIKITEGIEVTASNKKLKASWE